MSNPTQFEKWSAKRCPRLGATHGLALVFCVISIVVPALANIGESEPDRDIDLLKRLSLEELMDIEVTSVSRQPEKLSEAASAIQVITHEEIRRSGASNIPEILRLADNLDVAQQNSHQWAISARGFNTELANKLLVLMDGRSVYTPLFSGVFWNAQNYLLADIDRIEVISGPGGTLWGANAVNGVINITTKSASDTQGLLLEGGGGRQLKGFAGLRYGGKLGKNAHYRVYGQYFERDNEATIAGLDATDAWQRGQAGFRVDARTATGDNLTFQGDYYGSKEDMVTGGTSETNGTNMLGRWSRVSGPDSEMRLQAYYSRTHLDQPVAAAVFAPAGTLADDLDTYDLDFQHRFRLDARHRVVWGLGYRFTRDVVANAPALSFFPPILDQHLYSGFIQDEIALREDLAFTIGTKLEHNDYTGFELEPSARLQWKVRPGQMFWAAVSRAVRTPSRIDRDLSQPAPAYLLVLLKGGADFDSETVTAYEMGYRAQLGAKAMISLSAFANDYEHVRSISLSPIDPVFLLPLPLFFENNLSARTHGIELTAKVQVMDGWRLHGGYTFIEEDVRLAPGKTDFSNGLNEVADPRHRLSLRSSMDLPGRLELDLQWRWVDSRPMNNTGVVALVPAYSELDARLGWHATPNLELSIIGRNLLHARHQEYGVPAPTRGEIKRDVYAKVTWRF